MPSCHVLIIGEPGSQHPKILKGIIESNHNISVYTYMPVGGLNVFER